MSYMRCTKNSLAQVMRRRQRYLHFSKRILYLPPDPEAGRDVGQYVTEQHGRTYAPGRNAAKRAERAKGLR